MNTSSALLIIDVQNDFCPGGALAVRSGDEVVPVINSLSPLFSWVLATQDWHPPGHVSFASSHPGSEIYDRIDVGGTQQTLWPDHCVAGSEGAQFHHTLDLRPVKGVIRKGTNVDVDSYSGFFENDNSSKTGLAGFLKDLDIIRVYLAGLATDFCVLFTARHAVELGFETYLVQNAVRGVDVPEGSAEAAVAEMASLGVHIVDSTEVE